MKRRLGGNSSGSGGAIPVLRPHAAVLVPCNSAPVDGLTTNDRQIFPLGEDPVFLSLTPRSFAKSAAELDALRTRVQELELKLAQSDTMDAALASPQKSSTKRLPPLSEPVTPVDSSIAPTEARKTSVSAGNISLMRASFSITVPDESATANVTTISPRLKHSQSYSKLTQSPPREQTKISLQSDGEAVFAVSKRNRLYQILKRVSTIVIVPEDDLVMLKKLVDAEVGDVISFLIDLEHEESTEVISNRLKDLLESGSPGKQRSHRRQMASPRSPPVWTIQYPLQKIARNLEHLHHSHVANGGPPTKPEVIVLISSGAYNPIHMLHIRAFYVARQYVESNYKFPVVGAFISPSHDTYVRVKNRRKPHEMITKRHRLGIIEAAVASSSWIEVDKWEITRRRVLDYLSTLNHVREMCESHFPQFKFQLMYVCGCNTVVKLSHSALLSEGFGCITVCRPTQAAMVVKHLGRQLSKTAIIVEDTGVLPCDLERATSFRVRKALTHLDANAAIIELMVGRPVLQYFTKHAIGDKIAGSEPWTDEDKQWRDVDHAYVEYVDS